MDLVTHFPQTLRRHEVDTFSSDADDLHIGGILSVVY